MKIHEQFIKGKKDSPDLCEDGYIITPAFVAVADGVTSKDGGLFGGKTGGRAAMEKALAAVREFPADIDANEAFERINSAIGTLYGDADDITASACVIIYSAARSEVWSVGDCRCIIGGTLFEHEKEFDRIVSDMRSLVLCLCRLTGAGEKELLEKDMGREFILPVLRQEHLLGNSDAQFGFPVLDGRSFHGMGIEKHTVTRGELVVLASDGYPFLETTLLESEKELERVLKENPLCDLEYRSTKGVMPGSTSFDDRTYISFTA